MFCPFCGTVLSHIGSFCASCGGNIQFLRNIQDDGAVSVSDDLSEDELIHTYFTEGHTYEIIVELLRAKHNISVSLNTLKRRLKKSGLTRRTNYTPLANVHAVISEVLRGSSQLLGYRGMWQVLQQKHSLTVKRNDVMQIMADVDSAGVQQRSARRFVRRAYYSMGPNHIWHIDGYDKLKPYGMAISGCIVFCVCFSPSFLDILQKELDDYKQLWNTHTTQPVHQSHCPSGKPEAMYHLPQRFNGRNCGITVSPLALNQFNSLVPARCSPYGDDNLQRRFEDLQRQSGLPPPVNWTMAVETYITLKSLSGL